MHTEPGPDKAGEPFYLSIALSCNLDCVYCKSPVDGRIPSLAKACEEVMRRKIKNVGLGCSGEASINPDFLKWVKTLRVAGVEHFTLSTNALAFADADLCRQTVKEIDFFAVNLPSHLPAIYAGATRSDKFPLAMQALKNFKKCGALGKVAFAHIVSGLNFRALPQFADWVACTFPDIMFVDFVFVCNEGRVQDNPAIVPSYSAAAVFIKLALAKLRLKKIKAVVQNFPLCQLVGYEGFSLEFQRWEKGEKALEPGVAKRARCAACKNCTLAAPCYGARSAYSRIHGLKEFKASRLDPDKIISLKPV